MSISIFISYLALYLVIYLHEIGHALLYYKYGCKKNWWQVTVKPYLFFSTPLPVDMEKARLLNRKQNIFIASGGIGINLIFAMLTFLILQRINQNYYIGLFLHQFLTLHLGEAVSYLIIGNVYLVSDMEVIAKSKAILRPLYFVFGLFVGLFYMLFLIGMPEEYKSIIVAFNAMTILCMGVGRIVFTVIHNKRLNNHQYDN